ncbi:MAG TPA: hypothetical protein VMM36_07860 [Opitutaceae bacterium]|nr:hypothetical protein [Opitutaceae bacterium]
MDDSEKALRLEYRKHTSARLLAIAGNRKEYSFEKHLALRMVKEREFLQEFWTHGVIAWIALGLSLTSLAFTGLGVLFGG